MILKDKGDERAIQPQNDCPDTRHYIRELNIHNHVLEGKQTTDQLERKHSSEMV